MDDLIYFNHTLIRRTQKEQSKLPDTLLDRICCLRFIFKSSLCSNIFMGHITNAKYFKMDTILFCKHSGIAPSVV